MAWLACKCCDWLHESTALNERQEARCARCGAPLLAPRIGHDLQAGAAALGTAGIAFAVALATPLMGLSESSRSATTSLPLGALVMWLAGDPVTGVLVALCTVALPGLYLLLAAATAAGGLRTPVPRWVGTTARFASVTAPWAMPDVMLLATLVSYVKISELADATSGPAMYAIGALVVLLAITRHVADVPTVWSLIATRGARS